MVFFDKSTSQRASVVGHAKTKSVNGATGLLIFLPARRNLEAGQYHCLPIT
jgi:hypothetical protein